ncbi:glycosyltransferase family 4 protein [Mucilaginibacter sp. BT774]|uniref:glycosyltransferase family 4 protein n=1 Tax=Mucilaginibacter sp. BT774 TaxID=3062276 RepID=UPI002675622F|nr:glycosyltransferase family 4 protein [Mucilaginibacter sp. BT774]MDO3624784.1 glycosyltransferase family 4 protein [Mucilaginibacter sp. BT774]
MKYVFAGYVYTGDYNLPQAWLERIKAYTGILEALAKQNIVISIQQIDYEGQYDKNGVKYYFKRFGSPAYFPSPLHGFIKSLKPDVVIVQSFNHPFQVIQLRFLLGKGTKVIVHNHAELPFTGIKKYLQRLADKYVNAYLFASHNMGLGWVQKGNIGSANKIHEVMEVSSAFAPMDKEVGRQKTGVTEGLIFLWVGRLNANKDPLTVSKAFLEFAAAKPSARLYMIYHTEELLNDVKEMINKSPQKNAITLIGRVPHDELQYWFNSADIILSGSHYEGSGTAVCEAMSCGCMPIVTDIDSFRMITNNGKCGLLYEAGNAAKLLEALNQTSKISIAQKQKASLEYFRSNLSFEAIASRIQEIAGSL